MTNTEIINSYLEYNYGVLNRALNDITHIESLHKLQETGNNINWILGHIIVSRNAMCNILNVTNICDEFFEKLFGRGTKGFNDETVQLEKLLNTYNNSQEKILKKVSEFDWSKEEKQIKSLTFLCFHEAYHIGQLGILRRSLGKDGVAG